MTQAQLREYGKIRLDLGHACYLFVKNLMSFFFLFENTNFKIDRKLFVLYYGCETASRIKGGTQIEVVCGYGADDNRWWHLTGGCRLLHAEERHDVYCALNVVRGIRLTDCKTSIADRLFTLCQVCGTATNLLPLTSQYIFSLALFVVNNKSSCMENSQLHNVKTRKNSNLFQPSSHITNNLSERTTVFWHESV
jgi:hypothetical protein